MSTSAILTIAALGVAGSLLVARWLWQPPPWLRRLGRLRVPKSAEPPASSFAVPDDPVDRTLYETFEVLGVEAPNRSQAPPSGPVATEPGTECLTLEAIFPTAFPTAGAELTEVLELDRHG